MDSNAMPVTPEEPDSSGAWTYSETVARGLYETSRRGLFGKHDNVRTHWEDEMTRNALRPFVRERLAACATQGRLLRVLDLGCGGGQGYELLTQIRQNDLSLEELPRHVLEPTDLELYLGVDLSPSMVQQGRANYRGLPHVRFAEGDLREDLGPVGREPPFDLYFSSYGALSHLGAEQLESRLAQIAGHAAPGALVVLDLIGRYSLEWPAYWGASTEEEKVRPYSMSYLFGEEERARGDVETFPLRFWTGQEVRAMSQRVSAAARRAIRVCELFDRSIFVGRHVDTGEYGALLPPLRGLVNRLYEQNVRTNLNQLLIDFQPSPAAGRLNEVFGRLSHCWNTVIEFARQRLAGARIDLVEMTGWRDFPGALQMALLTLDRVIDSVSWIDIGDVRANIIEPQLAYVLQRMQYREQEGLGCGHGLVAVLSIGDDARSGPSTRLPSA
ncbi:MAG: class I SAM-dependent methyltransferase [Deltaproteobacteria bacterium]